MIPLHDGVPGTATVESDGTVRVGELVTHALDRYTRSLARPPALVVGFSTPSRAAFEPAIDALFSAVGSRSTDRAQPGAADARSSAPAR